MRTPNPLSKYVVTFVVAAVLLWGFGCAGERQAVKSAAWSGGGAAAGAAVGFLAGPGGAIAGAAIGGGAGHLIGENAGLRTGEIQGRGAADDEVARWRGEAVKTAGAFDWFKRFVSGVALFAAGIVALWFIWRNGNHIQDLGWFKGILRGLRKGGK